MSGRGRGRREREERGGSVWRERKEKGLVREEAGERDV